MLSQYSMKDEIKKLFLEISTVFPNLEYQIDENHKELDIVLDIPAQDGLKFPVHLNLQGNDELHLAVGHFWLEWFPCTSDDIKNAYKEAVVGLLSGKHRIKEFYIGSWCYRAQLQEYIAGKWKAMGTSGQIPFVIPCVSHAKIIINSK